MQGAGGRRPVRSARRTQRHVGSLGRRPTRDRHDLQPRGPAVGRRRAQSPNGVARQHRRLDELARGGAPAPLRALHPQLDRGVRPLVAQSPHAAGHGHAAHDDLRHLQGDGRDAGQLLPPQIRRRYPFDPFSGHHFERHAAGRRYDRLCRGDLLRSDSKRPLHLRRAPTTSTWT